MEDLNKMSINELMEVNSPESLKLINERWEQIEKWHSDRIESIVQLTRYMLFSTAFTMVSLIVLAIIYS